MRPAGGKKAHLASFSSTLFASKHGFCLLLNKRSEMNRPYVISGTESEVSELYLQQKDGLSYDIRCILGNFTAKDGEK